MAGTQDKSKAVSIMLSVILVAVGGAPCGLQESGSGVVPHGGGCREIGQTTLVSQLCEFLKADQDSPLATPDYRKYRRWLRERKPAIDR